MGKRQELERQLEAAKKAENALLNKLDECMTLPDQAKAKIYDKVVPFLRAHVKSKIDTGVWEIREVQIQVTDALVKAVFGEDALDNLNRV